MAKLEREVRAHNFSKEMRAEKTEDGKMTVEGYAIVYNQPANGWGFREVILPGAATKALLKGERFYLYQHNTEMPLAREGIETLEAKEDEKGVYIKATFVNNQRGRDVYEDINSGLVDKQSFAFNCSSDGVEWDQEEVGGVKIPLRKIREFENIYEFSAVTWPFYSGTDIESKNKEIALRNCPFAGTPEKKDSSTESKNLMELRKKQIKLQELL